MLAGASNFTISGSAHLYEIHGNAVINHITDTNEAKSQAIVNLPRAQASHKDYETKKKSGPCFPGTREVLLREMMDWVTEPGESRMYILSGLAGIGKSTVIYTLAAQADAIGLLGASFFFSRDEADRRNAKIFFTTIAFQLCVYNQIFSKAIGDVLLTERGAAATTQDPQDQLQVLILNPLQNIIQTRARPILIVIDALDECDEEDEHAVVMGLTQLVRLLPSFKVILTTRPQPLVDNIFGNYDGHRIFRLQDIEDKVVDGDIRLYLQHNFSLEQVQRCYPKRQLWCASDEEIDSLVRAAGRLFIIASTAVRYIFDKSASNPAAQMQKLLRAFARYLSPFKDLDHFYTVILWNVVPANSDDDDIVNRYRSVVGAIIFVQRPLPISTLAHLIAVDVEEIRAVLDNLQSVILLGSDDVPRIYHKSFPDYITDQARCKDPRLRIDPKIGHTQIATHCFEIMGMHLKYNILDLGDPARFMSNEDGLKEEGITDEQLQEKILRQLRYACVYWANHLDLANVEDVDLMSRLERCLDEHLLHWFELLSLIGQLDTAHRAIRVVLKFPSTTSFHQLLSDALRFMSKFYKLINRSALHTYYSALPFTPTNSLLYRRYIKQAVHNICAVMGGPEEWDTLVANLNHEQYVQVIKFSLDGALFISCSEERVDVRPQGKLKIWDTTTVTPISTISAHRFAITNDFCTVASSEDNIATYYNVNGSARVTMLTTSLKIQKLALSSESNRVAAALSDGTVWFWDSRNAELINSFDGFESDVHLLQFSPTGTRLACSSTNGIVKLWDGINGAFIADLQCGSGREFEFSNDGSRIASLSFYCGLTLWNSESGGLIGAVKNIVGWRGLTISAKGSLLATAGLDQVTLWSGSLVQIEVLEGLGYPLLMAFSLDNILAITTDDGVKLYNISSHSFISTLPFGGLPTALAFSPDCTRLALGTKDGNVYLWDIRSVDACGPPSKEEAAAISVVALSRDCSRLACGFEDGTVELRETSLPKRRIGPPAPRSKLEAMFFRIYRQSRHRERVTALAFGPNGRLFASGSDDGTIKLWDGVDGSLRGTLEGPLTSQAVALSNSVLAGVGFGDVTLWSLDTLDLIHTFETHQRISRLSIAENSAFVAITRHDGVVSLLDAVNCTTVATFDVPYMIHTMIFLRDNSRLVLQSNDGDFLSLDLIDKHIIKEPTHEYLIQLPNIPHWHDVPVWYCRDREQHYLAALFPQNENTVPVLWIPREILVTAWTQGSSMIALDCVDGHVILLRLAISHVDCSS